MDHYQSRCLYLNHLCKRGVVIGSLKIIMTDMELLETILRFRTSGEEIHVHLVTCAEEGKPMQQLDQLTRIQESAQELGVYVTWTFDNSGSLHARHIVTDTGWKISLDRGLDIFLPYPMNDAFSFANKMQQFRRCRAFEVTYIRLQKQGCQALYED